MALPPPTALEPQVIAPIVAAVTALVAVAVAPFVTSRSPKTQMFGPMPVTMTGERDAEEVCGNNSTY